MYKLLIVDDEAMIRKGLSTFIKWNQIGFEMSGAVEHAEAALAIMKSTEIDVLLTDISMPEMSGLELIRMAKELNPRIRSVVISGYSEFDYAVEALRLKVETYILKPLDPNKITEIFKKLKEEMDEERKQAETTDVLHSEYELMRLLNSDIRMIRGVYGNQREDKKFQVLLIQTLSGEHSGYAGQPSFLENCLIQEFYRTAGNLTAVITLSSRTEGLTEEILGEFKKRGLECRMAASRAVPELFDVMTLYLNAADELKRTCAGEIGFCQNAPFQTGGFGSEKFLSSFIRAAEEEGQEKLKKLTGSLFDELKRRQTVNPNSCCAAVLMGMILYFKLENISLKGFSSPANDGKDGGLNLGDVRNAFEEVLEQILSQLRGNSESLAVMVSYRARQYINENYSDKELSLRHVAQLLNVSYSYLSTEFNRTFGENFKSYLVSVRLERARELLLTRRYKIYEIADLAGYGSSRYFTDAFKKKYGISPVDYLNRLHQGL